jgi:hypothetical protein
MDPATGTRSKREKRRVENKEDIKHFLEEVLDLLPDETFYKKFSRDASKEIQDVLNQTKDELKNLTWKDINGDVIKLTQSEVSKIRSLDNYNAYRKANGNWPSNARDLRCNNITIDDWEDFIKDSVSTRTMAATGDNSQDHQ